MAFVVLTLALSASAQSWTIEDDEWGEDAKDYIAQHPDPDDTDGILQIYEQNGNEDEARLELVQGGRSWTCFARSRGGRVFSGRSVNANKARRIAMNRCISMSNGCSLRKCR
jgi:hypothetical protein